MIISIIIPTRERAAYLRESIQTALQIPDRNIEIVISDNASTDGTKQLVSEISDPRIKYVNTGRRVSMRENYEFGMRNSSGDYVIFFGDDDGILPLQFRFLRQILEKERPDVLRWNVPAFAWPVFDWPVKEYKTGSVMFNKNKLFSGIRQVDRDAARRHLLAGNLDQVKFPPVIYHGCVSREYFKRIAASDGTYFNGSAPDVYFSYRSILEGGKFMHVDHAFSLGGFSPASIGGAGASKRQAYDANSPRSESVRRHVAEYESDGIKDVIQPFPFSDLLTFFSILETVRALFPKEDQVLGYSTWYYYVLLDIRSEDLSWRNAVREILRDYATRSGSLSEFEQAESRQTSKRTPKTTGKCCSTSRRVFSEIKETLRNYATRCPIFPNPNRFRLLAEIDQKNTILTGANIYDAILSKDYEHILNGTGSRKTIWKRAIERSRAYPHSGNERDLGHSTSDFFR